MSNRIISLTILITIFTPLTISAQITIQNPLGSQNMQLWELIDKIIDLLFYAAAVVAPVIILVAAFKLLTSAGEVEKVQTAKRMIIWAVVGFIVIILSKALVSLLGTMLNVKTPYNP